MGVMAKNLCGGWGDMRASNGRPSRGALRAPGAVGELRPPLGPPRALGGLPEVVF